MTVREDILLSGNRRLVQTNAKLRESAQRQWESLHHYVETRTEEQPCGFCGSWGEHDNDSCDLVAVVSALEEDFGCGEHWRGESIPSGDLAISREFYGPAFDGVFLGSVDDQLKRDGEVF